MILSFLLYMEWYLYHCLWATREELQVFEVLPKLTYPHSRTHIQPKIPSKQLYTDNQLKKYHIVY